MRREYALFFLLAGLATRLVGAEIPVPVGPLLCAGPAKGEVRLDGKLDEPAWQSSVVASDMRQLGTSTAAARVTRFRFLRSADALLFAAESRTPVGGRRLLPKPQAKEHDGPVYGDESIEFYLQPVVPGPYYQFVVNEIGVRYEGCGMDSSWNGDWTAACAPTPDGWSVEARIPFATLGVNGVPSSGATWRFNVAKNDRINQQYQSWAELTGGFHDPAHFGMLRFTDLEVGAGPLELTRRGQDMVLEMPVRAGSVPVPAVRLLGVFRSAGGEVEFQPVRDLGSGQAEVFTVTAPEAWVPRTTVSLAYAIEANGERLYTAPRLGLPAESVRPLRPPQPVPVTIENGEIALTFDGGSGLLLQVRNKAGGLDVSFGGTGTAVLELDAVRYIRNPRFFREEDVQTLVPDHATLAGLQKREGPEGQVLEIEHHVEPDLVIRLTVCVPPRGVESEWRVELQNPLPLHPTGALVVHRVRYPHLTNVAESACGPNPFVITPVHMGQKIPEPAKNLGPRRTISYIGGGSMGWIDFYGDKGGLYFKVGDLEPLPQTDLVAQGEPKDAQLRLGIQRWALCWPGETWKPGPCTLGIHAGDWHAAADLYRAWFRANFRQYPVPPWLKDAEGYVMAGGNHYEFADFPRIIENALSTGISYMQLWSEMIGGEWSYHACAFPNPYMGTEKELTKAIAELHARGGHMGIYLNFNTGDPLLGTFLRQPANDQKMPKDIRRPALDYMKDNWIQQSIMGHDGSYSTWNCVVPGYLDGYWNACPAADKWTAHYYYWVVDKWAKEYKADVWYLDSCPVSRGTPCFAFDHGHDRPAPEGQSIIEFYRRMRAGAPKEFCIMQEYNCDRLLPYSTHALGLMWHGQHSHAEVLRYTLPEYVLFSGMCNGIEGMKWVFPDEPVNYVLATEYVFLLGNRYEFNISNRPPDMASDWQRKMVGLRKACHDEMNYGDFLDTIGLGEVPAGVSAKLFRRADRGRLAVTLLDRRKENRGPFSLGIDLAAVGVGAAKAVELVTLEARQPLDPPAVQGGRVAISVPVYVGRPAALLVETAAPAGR